MLCFQQKKSRLDKYEAAAEKLNEDTDIVKFIRIHRLSEFLSQVYLKKHQSAMIPKFKAHSIEENEKGKDNQDGHDLN